MRRLATTAALTLALTAGGMTAATAEAAPVTTAATTTHSVSTTTQGHATVALGSTMAKQHAAQKPDRRRRYQTHRRRSGIGRFFGFLGFLFCLPFLLIIVAALIFMMRRNARRRQEDAMRQQQMNAQSPQQGRWDDPYGR